MQDRNPSVVLVLGSARGETGVGNQSCVLVGSPVPHRLLHSPSLYPGVSSRISPGRLRYIMHTQAWSTSRTYGRCHGITAILQS
jgi:hypothetical protein